MKVIVAILALTVLTTGCAHSIDSSTAVGVPRGEVITVNESLLAYDCTRFTSSLSFWGGPRKKRCLAIESEIKHTDRLFGKEVLTPPIFLKVTKATSVNGIDFVDEVIFLQDQESGKKYISDVGTIRTLESRVQRTER